MTDSSPSADLESDPNSGDQSVDEAAITPVTAGDPALPRTVKRRPPRRVAGTAPMRPMSVARVLVTSTEPEPAPAVEPEPAAAVEPETEIGGEPSAVPEVDVETEIVAGIESEAGVEDVAEAGIATEAGTEVETPPVEEAPPVAPAVGLVEVPVPSVVRARERAAVAAENPVVLRTEHLTKSYGSVLAAAEVSIEVRAGSFTGFVGPNGAGKTTVLSMISGLNRPSSGRITVRDIDVWSDGPAAKRVLGTLPDRLRLFDRLTGAQLLYYAGVLHGVDEASVAQRAGELAKSFGLESALDRPVSDYSAGMQKKIGLACAMIHAPEVLVLDEPFEAIDPVSAANVTEILEKFVAGGGSVIMSSHSLELIQRVCDHVVVIADGSVIAQGTADAVRDGMTLEERFRHLTHTTDAGKGLEWLHGSADSD